MGKGKIELKKIDSTRKMQAVFSKQQMGLLKKEHKLYFLCDA